MKKYKENLLSFDENLMNIFMNIERLEKFSERLKYVGNIWQRLLNLRIFLVKRKL